MRSLLALGTLALFAAPVPAMAQSNQADALAEVTETLRDPMVQDQMAGFVAALSQVLLDTDLTPLAEAAEKVAGEPVPDLERGKTLRELAPEAEALPETIDREMPQVLDRMADMGEAMQTMLPMLREMGAAMKQAIEENDISVR